MIRDVFLFPEVQFVRLFNLWLRICTRDIGVVIGWIGIFRLFVACFALLLLVFLLILLFLRGITLVVFLLLRGVIFLVVLLLRLLLFGSESLLEFLLLVFLEGIDYLLASRLLLEDLLQVVVDRVLDLLGSIL